MPPEPRRSRAPRIIEIIPSMNKASVGEKRGFEDSNQRLMEYTAQVNIREMQVSLIAFRMGDFFIGIHLKKERGG